MICKTCLNSFDQLMDDGQCEDCWQLNTCRQCGGQTNGTEKFGECDTCLENKRTMDNQICKTTEELIAKFPNLEPEPEDSYIRDIGLCCPQCGERHNISVATTTECKITPNGTEDIGEYSYEDVSPAYCGDCSFSADLAVFEFEGLDDEIESRKESK